MAALLLVLGLAVLTFGAEVLVRAASALALAMRISPLVVGLTVVSFGTSAPELVVSVVAAYSGASEIALGNVVGSNIVNVLLILGLSAAIIPLTVAQRLVRFEVPLMIGISLLLWALAISGSVERVEGLILVALLVVYVVWTIVDSRRQLERTNDDESLAAIAEHPRGVTVPAAGRPTPQRIALQLVQLAVGLGLLVLGSRMFTGAAIELARYFGVSELVIGLTIVSLGTSLPEVATSVVAAIRGERDLAVGNVVGSNLFNILAVLGISASVAPAGIDVPQQALDVDVPVMIAVAVACLPIFFTGLVIARWEGLLFLAYYTAYLVYQWLAATSQLRSSNFATAMLGFVVPLTAITLLVTVWQSLRKRREARSA